MPLPSPMGFPGLGTNSPTSTEKDPGYRRKRAEPLGTRERREPTLSCLRTFSMKNFQHASRVSVIPRDFTCGRMEEMIFSRSSSPNKPGISPEASKSLISTRNCSSATWESVIRNTEGTFFTADLMYWAARSSWIEQGQWSQRPPLGDTFHPHLARTYVDHTGLWKRPETLRGTRPHFQHPSTLPPGDRQMNLSWV